jgi:hypothetical protein
MGEPRSGEKIHELLYSNEESLKICMTGDGTKFMFEPDEYYQLSSWMGNYSSKDHVMTKDELKSFLESQNYFMP